MKRIPPVLAAALIALPIGAAAHGGDDSKRHAAVKKEQKEWGIAGDAKDATRTIEITMSDAMRFSPDTIDVRQGETIKFIVKNSGRTMHEMVIGTRKDLDDHAVLMTKFPGMEHDEPFMTHVRPRKKGEIVWTFNRAGEFHFACLIPGHYRAGMVGWIRVSAGTGQ